MSRPAGTRQVLLWGSIPAGAAVTESVAIDDPAYYAACALYDALLRRGISIRGRPVARHRLGFGGLRSGHRDRARVARFAANDGSAAGDGQSEPEPVRGADAARSGPLTRAIRERAKRVSKRWTR